MIQRIQTIFLLIVAVCMISVVFSTIWEKVSIEDQEKASLTAISLIHYTIDTQSEDPSYTVISEKPTYYIAIAAILSALVALYSIMQYKNRITQLKLGFLNILLIAATLGTSIYYMYEAERLLALDMQGAYKIGIFLPAIALLANSMANRFIKRDEDLVRSVDRIR